MFQARPCGGSWHFWVLGSAGSLRQTANRCGGRSACIIESSIASIQGLIEVDRGEPGVPRWRRGLWPTGGKGPPRASFLTHGGEIGAAVCGRMRLAGVWALRRGRASGATAPRGPTARHHSVAPSEDVGEEYHERDQNHGADHDD